MKTTRNLVEMVGGLVGLLALTAFSTKADPPLTANTPAPPSTAFAAEGAESAPSNAESAAKGSPEIPKGPPLPAGLLAWNAESQRAKVAFGAPEAQFSFRVTNVGRESITVTGVRATCGCTVPKLPPLPWTLEPGRKGAIEIAMKLSGKRGTVAKAVTVITDHGLKTLEVRTDIEGSPPEGLGPAERARNIEIATVNRQASLKGECASCHTTPALGKQGGELYHAACTICHEAHPRSAAVPDLKYLRKPTNAEYWRKWITSSEAGKLMPAFGTEHGGILTARQIDSLVDFLVENIPSARPGEPSPVPSPLLTP